MNNLAVKVTTRITFPTPAIIFPSDVRRHYHDAELHARGIRNDSGQVYSIRNPNDLEGTPEVYRLDDDTMRIDAQWQWYLVAINYTMALNNIAAILAGAKAFCNKKGIENRRNYILGENLNALEVPQFSATFYCGGGIMTGTTFGNKYKVKTMDGNHYPPLKEGKRYPASLAEMNRHDYLYLPETHPWMFYPAVNIRDSGTTFPFAKGGFYSWTPEPNRMFTFLPLVSEVEILYPLDRLMRVDHWVSPYMDV